MSAVRTSAAWLIAGLLTGAGCGSGASGGPMGSPADARLTDAEPDAPADARLTDAEPDAPADARHADARAADAQADARAADAPLQALPGPAQAVDVGAEVVLDGSASTGAVAYQWDFGDGTRQETPGPDPVARVTYAAPGRFRAVLTAFDRVGNRSTATALITATHPPLPVRPVSSGTIALAHGPEGALRVAVVVPDADRLVILREGGPGPASFVVESQHAVGDEPRTVTAVDDGFVVACRGADRLDLVRPPELASGPTPAAESVRPLPLPPGARPFGVVGRPGEGVVYATLSARGAVARVPLDGGPVVEIFGFPDARGLAWGQGIEGDVLFVSRWRSRDGRGLLWRLTPQEIDLHDVPLAFDPQASSDTEIGGVPSLLDVLALAPHGRELAVPSLQANTGGGLFRTGVPLTHQTTIRAVVSFVDVGPDAAAEVFARRKQFDNRGFAHAAVYSSRGDHLFVSMPGARTIERLDRLDGTQSGTLVDVGHHIAGLALTPDDRLLLADAALDRALVVYDVSDFSERPEPVARIDLLPPDAEPFAPEVLQGKRLFHDAADPRLTRDMYVACAHCHPDGEDDGLTWDFTDRGEGLRNTISLAGRGGDAHGPIHWSGNFDEIQDFEHDIRGPFGGEGLLPDADFHAAGRDHPLRGPKAGAGEDLDALAAYVGSLTHFPRSPRRAPDGTLPPEAERGRALFDAPETGCRDCHGGPSLTDSAFIEGADAPERIPRVHDVGTLDAAAGQRLGGVLTGFDTPTLHGLWDSAPYLHDGRALTLREVFTVHNPEDLHGVTSPLDARQIEDLVAYLECLDGRPE
ncbi:PKD domain-containing protein [Myxococcota bacterium]|nr:PKD domain-containing protein [Myxococcota bacterium]